MPKLMINGYHVGTDISGSAESIIYDDQNTLLGATNVQKAIETTNNKIPRNTSQLNNDSGYITGYTETDPTVPSHVKSITQNNINSWNNKLDSASVPTKLSDLGDDATHRVVTDSQITAWNNKLDSTDITIPTKLSELTPDTTHRVVTDAQITSWNSKLDSASVPKNVSQLNNDAGYITGYTESDPTVPGHVKSITQADITSWNNKLDSASVPKKLSQLSDDATHRLVTDTEKAAWNAKLDSADIPTNVSAFTNDSKYQTESQVASAISTAIAGVTSFNLKVVASLPSSGVKGTMYLVLSGSSEDQNIYDEYLWITDKWEKIGDTKVDLTGYAKTSDLAKVATSNSYTDLVNKPTIPVVPKNVSSFTNDAGYITEFTEIDPTVPDWAKKSSPPKYTKSDVGLGNVGNFKAVSTVANQGLTEVEKANARANIGAGASSFSGDYNDLTNAPTNVSAFNNDSGYLTSYTETDPTVPSWAKQSKKPTYTAEEVGLGNVGNFKAVSTVAGQGLTDAEKANARANIGAGSSAFSGNYSDLVGAPTNVSAFNNDAKYLTSYTETDPTVPAHVKLITQANITAWNNKMDKVTLGKVATSNNYDDLDNKPTIPVFGSIPVNPTDTTNMNIWIET